MDRRTSRRWAVVAVLSWAVALTGMSIWLVHASGWPTTAGGVRVDQVVALRTGSGFVVQAVYEGEKPGDCVPRADVSRTAATEFTVDAVPQPQDGFHDLQCLVSSDHVELYRSSTDPTGATVTVNGTPYAVALP